MKRKVSVVGLLLVLALPALVAFAPMPQGQPKINMSISAGYNGYSRPDQWTPIRVTISNDGDNMTGDVRLRTGGNGLAETIYKTPIDLPHGARKQIFLYVSLDGYGQSVQVELIDDEERVVDRQNASLRTVSRGDILYAVVTESAYGAVDLAIETPGTGDGYQINWQLDHIPPLAEALEGLDVLMFHDVDTGALKVEQLEAIRGWVLAGGHLIVAGGDTWQRTTNGLQTLLPVELQGTVTVPSLSPLADYLKLPEEALDQETTITQTTPFQDTRLLASVGEYPLLVRGSLGAGIIDFFAADPNVEPLRSWGYKGRLWYTLVSSTGQRPSWAKGFQEWSIARDATLTTSNTALPTFLQLCGFLSVYIVLVGPANYLILKRLNRRELAWFTIPVLIVVFSVLAYEVGFNLRGNVPLVNRLTVVRVWPGVEQSHVVSLVGVQSPRRSTYDVAVERGYALRTLPVVGNGLDVSTTVSEGTRYVAEDTPVDAGMVASFDAAGFGEAPSLGAQATWHLFNTNPPYVSGSITNTTGFMLSNAVVLIKGESRFLGSLMPGETRTFEITMGPQDPGPLTLGNPLSQYYYNYNPWSISGSPSWCFSTEGVYLTVPDVMRNDSFSCSAHGVSDREQEIRRRYRLLGSLVVDRDISGGRGAGVYLFAWADTAPFDLELIGRSQDEENTTLYIFELPVTVEAHDPQVEVPPGLTTWMIVAADDPTTLQDILPIQFGIDVGSQAAFGFMPLPDVQLAHVDEVIIKFEGQGPLQVEVWNWQSEEWVRVWLDSTTYSTSLRNTEAFLGPENAVHVRITATDPNVFNQVEYIKVAYRGQLTVP